MKRITAEAHEEIENHLVKITDLQLEAQDLLGVIKEKIEEVVKSELSENGYNLEDIQHLINEELEIVEKKATDVFEKIDHYYDDRSEKWQCSDDGVSYEYWRDSWHYFKNTLADRFALEDFVKMSYEYNCFDIEIGTQFVFEVGDDLPAIEP